MGGHTEHAQRATSTVSGAKFPRTRRDDCADRREVSGADMKKARPPERALFMRLRYATGANQCKSSPICLSVMKKEIAFSTLARLNPCTSLRYLRMNSPLFGSGKWTSLIA